MSSGESKQQLRERLKHRRSVLKETKPDAAQTLADRFPVRLLERFGPVVSGYWPIGSEFDCRPLLTRLRALGAHVVLPSVEENGAMVFRAWSPGEDLVQGPFGLEQPEPSAEQVDPTLVLLPLLGFDANGNRLGYGKGHYDRALARLREKGRAFACGISFAAQQVDHIPAEPHDIPLDWVVTEEGSVPVLFSRANPAAGPA